MDKWIVLHNGKPVCAHVLSDGKVNAVSENGRFLNIRPHAEDAFVFSGEGFTVSDEITQIQDDFYFITRHFQNTSDTARSVVLYFELETFFVPDFYMIPSVSYNGNPWGTGNEPKGLSVDGEPWVFAYNRVALPSATFSEDGVVSVGLFADDSTETSLVSACSMTPTESGMIHRLIWPDRETPKVYYARDAYAPADTPELTIAAGGCFSVAFYISVSAVRKPFFGWMDAFDRAQTRMKRDIDNVMRSEEFWAHRINYIKNTQLTGTGANNDYTLLDMGLLPNGNIYNYFPERHDISNVTFQPRTTPGERHFEIGWCGQNASMAVALIYDYIKNNDKTSLHAGINVLDTWAQHAPLPNGLFEVIFDEVLQSIPDKHFEIDTCNLGWGMWQMLEAYQALQSLGIDKPAYKKMALDACDFFVMNRAADGSFGKIWSKEGVCLDAGGTIGCFILLGLIKAHQITSNPAYLSCATDMYIYYVERDLYRMECTAGALDTHCIDKETAWPLLKCGLDLYHLTKNPRFLEDAQYAAYYILSFTFQYDALYGPETDFIKHGYRTYGGTSVSTQHHHLDPWGSLIAYDFFRLYEETKQEKWRIWSDALWKNAMLCVSDGKQVVHDLLRPAGTQNEMFMQCRFTFDLNTQPGRLNDWLQSWPGAFKLITLYRAHQDKIKNVFS
ncbi:MAG: hypothetical protein FWC71_03600 [Defluviitaleaceae bacterium]|nr:hypothetical protein [Defluviitaleaceae bacterium]